MAVLSDTERQRIAAHLMRGVLGNVPTCLKADLRLAVDATDAWVDANSAAFNLTLPVVFRANATSQQKTLLFCLVAMRRAGLLRVQED